jgi:hypothetical protein
MTLDEIKKRITKADRDKFLKDNPEVYNWYVAKNFNKRYLTYLMRYCIAVDMTPSQLLELKKEYGDVRAEQKLEVFQAEYKQKFGEDALRFNITTAVKSWYTFNGKQLTRGRARVRLSHKRKKEPFSKDDIVPFSDAFTGVKRVQFKAIVGFLSSLPCRINTLVKLNWNHVKEALDDRIQTPYVEIEQQLLKQTQTGTELYQRGFLHSYARKVLLEWRDAYEKITKSKLDIANEKSLERPLFIGTKKKRLPDGSFAYERIHSSTIELWFKQRSKQYGKKIIPHTFRAFVNDGLMCSEDYKALILGHQCKYQGAYSFAMEDIKRLREAFLISDINLNPLHTEETERYKTQLEQIENKIGEKFTDKQKDAIARALAQGFIKLEIEYNQRREDFIQLFTEEIRKTFQEISSRGKA